MTLAKRYVSLSALAIIPAQPKGKMKTKNSTATNLAAKTEENFITVHIPDYDTSFVYQLKFGGIEFGDNNELDIERRARLTDFVSVVNARLLSLQSLQREHAALVAVAEAARKSCTLTTHDGIRDAREDARLIKDGTPFDARLNRVLKIRRDELNDALANLAAVQGKVVQS